MSEPLDYRKLESVCWRALCRHCVSELEMLISATVIRLSFGIGEPYLRLDYAIELARFAGISKGKAHEVVRRLERGRALEVSQDRCIYTFLPPSTAWPWLFKERVEFRLADELERGIVWAAKGEKQAEFFGPTPEREFAEALAIERMRTSLVESHNAAAARYAGGFQFPVTDRSPRPAPASQLSSGEGHTRPLGTSVAGVTSPTEESFTPELEAASAKAAMPQHGTGWHDVMVPDGSRKGNPVPEKGTSLLKAFKGLERTALLTSESFKEEFPNRELIRAPDPSATEEDIIAWLRTFLGKMCRTCHEAKRRGPCKCPKPDLVPVMDIYGGFWRLKIRESRWAALNLCQDLMLRLSDHSQKPLRNRGGWARDQWFRIRGEEGMFQQDKPAEAK